MTLRSQGDQRLNDFVVASNSTGMVHSEQMIDLGGAFDWQDPRLTSLASCPIRRR